MFLRSPSSWRLMSTLSSHLYPCSILGSTSHVSASQSQLLTPSTHSSQSQRPFLFWRANIKRELYGTPGKAAATRKRRRLQKSITEIIRDGQLWRFLKESFLPEWKRWWKEFQPWDRRYSLRVTFSSASHSIDLFLL
jgi:hypothetical protein